jgi:ribulose-phosphate 3-epimerase
MSPRYLISASILSADFSCLGEQIHQAEEAGADWIHVDVMDGHFVPNLTMGPFIVEACRKITRLPLDVHLMIESPENLLSAFAHAGASNLTVHVETCPDWQKTVQTIHCLGCKAGVVLNPVTPIDELKSVLPLVDLVLVMSVNPGYSGQQFMPEVLPKLAAIRQMLNEINHPAFLEVDGGIDVHTIPLTLNAGADVFVAASAIFDHPRGIAYGVKALRSQFPV